LQVNLYSGSFSLIRRSGVGQAILHQKEMLECIGIKTTTHWSDSVGVVHINTIFPDSLAASLIARLKKKKIVYYGHSTMEDFRSSFKCSNFLAPFFKRWIKRCYENGDVIITPTEYSKKILKSYGIKKPIYSLSNGVDTDFFKPSNERRMAFRLKYGLNPDEKVVMSVGHYIERKGILDFIELARKMPQVKFFWFGYTNLNLVPKKISSAIKNAPENLYFPGYVEQSELRDAYCGCDLFDFMSTEETEGIVVLEALACGIPTIVRNIPVYNGWLKNGINIYKASDLNSFAEKTKYVLNGQLPDVTIAGEQVAQGRSISKVGKKLMEIYKIEHIL
jgi:1,2-diacylglycerol-3-alpha-glucose alpha-1,2-glucosyltransferase